MIRSRELLDRLSPEKRALLALRLRESRQDSDPAATALPAVVIDQDRRYEPFPLTDLQQAYWLGRTVTFEIGSIPSKAYVELECVDFDLERFNLAWQRLIACHDMLRVIVLEDGRQQVLETVPIYRVKVSDLRRQDQQHIASHLEDTYQEMLYDNRGTDEWPLFDIRVSWLDDQLVHVHICLDLLNFDAGSIVILFKQLAHLYQTPEAIVVPPELTYRDYVMAERTVQDAEMYQRSREYWLDRLATLPPAPDLPLAKNPTSVEKPQFVRRQAKLKRETWNQLRTRARQTGVTLTGLLLTVYAEVLQTWSNSAKFTVNIPVFNRLPLHPQVNDLVGDFTTVNLLEVDCSTPESFETRVRRVQEQLLTDLGHRYMGGVEVLRELARLDRANFGRGVPVVFTTLLDHGFSEAISQIGRLVRSINQTAQVWIDLHVDEQDGELLIKWDAVEELFPEGFVDAMFGAYVHLLDYLAAGEESWQEIHRPMLPQTQIEQRAAINSQEAPIPEGLLHTLFEAQVAQRTEQPAVITTGRTLTYEELHRFANRVGRRLREMGAKPNQLVAVVMDKGWEQVVAVLGILTSGAAYVPIDPEFPKERFWHLLNHTEVELILTQSWLDQSLDWPDTVQRICIDLEETWADVDDSPLQAVQTQGDTAYVLYTSGSTGLPKGVVLTHRGAVNRMLDVSKRFGIGPADRAIAVTALQHDLSIFDMFGMLAIGGSLVIPDSALRRDPEHWTELMLRERMTIWNSVPAFMEMFVEYLEHRANSGKPMPDSLRMVLMSGDWIPVGLPDRIRALMKDVQVIGLGGPTETTTWDICNPIQSVDAQWKSIPYGRPMVNAQYHIFDQALEPCPVWVTGEMYIGGVGLARGYWRDEEKTRAKFIEHPQTGERLYRSGDLGRYLPDGNIEFMGRADFQVKIRGQRIELGEIESTLEQHDAVRAAVVTTVGETRGQNKQLVAYVVPTREPAPTANELCTFLVDKLPEHMVPSAFMILERLPLTRMGKVDRRSLPDPTEAISEPISDPAVEATQVTAQVARIVANVLKIDQPSPDANLINLGANSIDMIRIGNQLENEFGFRPGMDKIFRLPTIEALTSYVVQQLPDNGRGSTEGSGVGFGTEVGMNPDIASIVNSFEMLLELEERDAFREKQPGLRHDVADKPFAQLMMPERDAASRKRYDERRSYRNFSPEPIALEQFSRFLSELSQITLDGQPKYLYASAGGIYPIQTYLHVKPERVDGLDAGIHYYHPVDHRLVLILADAEIDRNIHVPFVNQPTFDEAAFSIFLITQLNAIAPLYGEYSFHFSVLEAGIIAHLLETAAPQCGIGLCQIGSVDFDQIRHLFALDETHFLTHSLLGGRIRSPEDISRLLGFLPSGA